MTQEPQYQTSLQLHVRSDVQEHSRGEVSKENGMFLKGLMHDCKDSKETHLVSEFDTVELVRGLQQLRPEGGGDELGVACELHDHV